MDANFSKRRHALLGLMKQQAVECLLVSEPANWYYLTGFTGEAGALLVSQAGTTLITDGRFVAQGRQEMTNIRVVQHKGGLYPAVGEFLRGVKTETAGFNGAHLTVEQLAAAKKAAGRSCRWKSVPGMVIGLRSRKDGAELAQMRKAAILAGDVLERVVPLLKPGVRESEIGAEIEYRLRKRGASGVAFESIVAFGERSALPHARPTSKRLRKNELVVLDLGAILGHYCSDMTRTVHVGRAPERIRTWYKAVLEAQAAAVGTVRAGVKCGEVDEAARKVLAGYRLDKYFVHSTGHGLGLQVHEEPRVARGQQQRLELGNVITIEPGVYVPGVGGIRIEDDVSVQASGNEVLTRVPRDLIEL